MNEEFKNYFNYFTEIEDHFQRVRGTGLFLLSPLDWALIETWKNSGIPLEAVLRGIDAAFEKWRARRQKTQLVNSITYCAQSVLREAQRAPDAARHSSCESQRAPFRVEELRRYIGQNAETIRATEAPEFAVIADALDKITGELPEFLENLEKLEQRLAVLEQKMIGLARGRESEQQALAARRELEVQLRPYRRKMTAPQLTMLETQFLERTALEAAGLPRLSLFYLH